MNVVQRGPSELVVLVWRAPRAHRLHGIFLLCQPISYLDISGTQKRSQVWRPILLSWVGTYSYLSSSWSGTCLGMFIASWVVRQNPRQPKHRCWIKPYYCLSVAAQQLGGGVKSARNTQNTHEFANVATAYFNLLLVYPYTSIQSIMIQ